MANAFSVTIEGAFRPGGVGSPHSVMVYTTGPKIIPSLEGDVRKFQGGNQNDASLWRMKYELTLIYFVLTTDGGIYGHNFTLFRELFEQVLSKPYRRITAVGPMSAESSGVHAWWTEKLAASAVDVMITSVSIRWPDDGTVEVTLGLQNRKRGL